MSYAEIAAVNTVPFSEQPHPDPALLNTTPPSASGVIDETKKVNVVSQDFKTHPATTTSERNIPYYGNAGAPSRYPNKRRTNKQGEEDYRRHLPIVNPTTVAGMVGLFNAAVLGTIGYFSYVNWSQPTWSRRTISATAVGLLTLWSGEG